MLEQVAPNPIELVGASDGMMKVEIDMMSTN
jgi:hypothetical protein